MNFQIVEANIKTLLDSAPGKDYQVIGSPHQNIGSDDINENKKIQVFFERSSFGEGTNSYNNYQQSESTFKINLYLSARAEYTDQADPESLTPASEVANRDMNNFISQVYQIIMAGDTLYLGLDGVVSNRYIKDIRKVGINDEGDKVVMICEMDLSCRIHEDVPEPLGVTGDGIKSSFGFYNVEGTEEDEYQKTGIETNKL